MRIESSPRGVVVFLEGSEISRFYEDEGAVFDNATERLSFAPAYVTVRNEDGDLLREIHVDSMPRPRMPSRKPDRPEWLKKVRSVFGYKDNPRKKASAGAQTTASVETTALYHTTLTSHLPRIQKEGLRPMQTSNWVMAGDKKRYGKGEVYAFESMKDAIRWAAKWDWSQSHTWGSGKIAIVEVKDQSLADWTTDDADPISQASSEGRWLKSSRAIGPEHLGEVTPFTAETMQRLRLDNPLTERGASMHHPPRRPPYDENPKGRYVGVHGRHAFHATRGNHPSYAHPVHGPYASPARAGAIARRAHKKMEDYKDNPRGEGRGVRGEGLRHPYEDNPRRYEENCGVGCYDDNPRKKGHSDLVDVERLAIMFGIPTFDEAWSEDADWEASKYARDEAIDNGGSEEDAEEAGFAAEQASQDERYHLWHDAVTSAVEHEFSEHGLTLVPRTGEGRSDRYPWEYRVVPTMSWMDAARKIMVTINGVGQFEFRNVREFLESGPWTAREAVLTHLHWMKDRAEVYGDKSALGRYERALR